MPQLLRHQDEKWARWLPFVVGHCHFLFLIDPTKITQATVRVCHDWPCCREPGTDGESDRDAGCVRTVGRHHAAGYDMTIILPWVVQWCHRGTLCHIPKQMVPHITDDVSFFFDACMHGHRFLGQFRSCHRWKRGGIVVGILALHSWHPPENQADSRS